MHCFSLSLLVLQKSSPEQRQIDLLTMLQNYTQSMEKLLKITHFSKDSSETEKFQLQDDNNETLDVNALNNTIQNVASFLRNSINKIIMGSIILEAKILPLLIGIPQNVKNWNIDLQTLASTLIKTITFLCAESEEIQHFMVLPDNIHKLFINLRLMIKPNHNVVEECLRFAFLDEINLNAAVVGKLIEWLVSMSHQEQDYLSGVLMKKSKLNIH